MWAAAPLIRARPSDDADVLRFFAFATGCDIELDAGALFEGLVSGTLDVGEVDEYVVPLLSRNEAKALFRVEELHRTYCQRILVSERTHRSM